MHEDTHLGRESPRGTSCLCIQLFRYPPPPGCVSPSLCRRGYVREDLGIPAAESHSGPRGMGVMARGPADQGSLTLIPQAGALLSWCFSRRPVQDPNPTVRAASPTLASSAPHHPPRAPLIFSNLVSSSAWAATAKCHRLGGLNNRNVYSHPWGGCKV